MLDMHAHIGRRRLCCVLQPLTIGRPSLDDPANDISYRSQTTTRLRRGTNSLPIRDMESVHYMLPWAPFPHHPIVHPTPHSSHGR